MPQITYTGTFKVIQQIVDWINNFTPSISGLDDLTDVDISSPQNDEVLKYNSTTQKWENGAGGGGSSGHTIVDPNGTSMPSENKLQFTGAVSVSDDSTNGQTVVNVVGGGSSTLAGLTDVTLNSPNDSEVLFYDAATSKWINGTIASLPKIYSATEREVGCWTDGKPLYQKTVHISALPDSTRIGQYVDYPHDIANIDTICGFEGVLHFPNGNALGPVRVGFSVPAGFNYQITIDSYCTTSYVRIAVGADRSTVSADYTLWYTKTTDTPGSGRVTPLATPTVHYSENEEVVGTWIDGKTIYQKTVKFLSQALAAGDNDLNLGIPTIETVVDSKAMITNSAHTTYRPLNTWTPASSGQLFYLIDPSSGKLRVHTEGAWASPNIFITLQYTKITS